MLTLEVLIPAKTAAEEKKRHLRIFHTWHRMVLSYHFFKTCILVHIPW